VRERDRERAASSFFLLCIPVTDRRTALCFFRFVFCSYAQYAQITAQAVRNVLKGEAKVASQKREHLAIKYAKWENGKQAGPTRTSDYAWIFYVPNRLFLHRTHQGLLQLKT